MFTNVLNCEYWTEQSSVIVSFDKSILVNWYDYLSLVTTVCTIKTDSKPESLLGYRIKPWK